MAFVGRNGSTTSTTYAPLVSPAFTGTPTVPTAPLGTNTTQAANMAAVKAAIDALLGGASPAYDTLQELATALVAGDNAAATLTTTVASKAPLVSPSFSGTPTTPTAALGTNSTQIANMAAVKAASDAAAAAGVTTFNGRTGGVSLGPSDVTTALGYTPYNSTNPSGYLTAATVPVKSVNGQTGDVVLSAEGPIEPRRITAAGTYVITGADKAVFIDPNTTGTVAFTLDAAYPAGQRLLLVDARPGPSTTVITPDGTTIIGGASYTLDNSFGGWAAINLLRSTTLGWSLS